MEGYYKLQEGDQVREAFIRSEVLATGGAARAEGLPGALGSVFSASCPLRGLCEPMLGITQPFLSIPNDEVMLSHHRRKNIAAESIVKGSN